MWFLRNRSGTPLGVFGLFSAGLCLIIPHISDFFLRAALLFFGDYGQLLNFFASEYFTWYHHCSQHFIKDFLKDLRSLWVIFSKISEVIGWFSQRIQKSFGDFLKDLRSHWAIFSKFSEVIGWFSQRFQKSLGDFLRSLCMGPWTGGEINVNLDKTWECVDV